MDESNKAFGELFWDDGVSLIDTANPNYYYMKFVYEDVNIFYTKKKDLSEIKLYFKIKKEQTKYESESKRKH